MHKCIPCRTFEEPISERSNLDDRDRRSTVYGTEPHGNEQDGGEMGLCDRNSGSNEQAAPGQGPPSPTASRRVGTTPDRHRDSRRCAATAIRQHIATVVFTDAGRWWLARKSHSAVRCKSDLEPTTTKPAQVLKWRCWRKSASFNHGTSGCWQYTSSPDT